jgi:PTH1 family peptidyl-tRNA hydrolase
MDREIYVIVGLGNPGAEYAHTRHNAGFEVMALLEERFGVKLRKKLLLEGEAAEWTDGEKKVVLCRPTTFMNLSGRCVRKVVDRFGCDPSHLLVIYDDIDLPPGKVRVRKSGGPGTHNGMRSIVEELGHTDFPRIRVGTGDRPAGQDLAAWVLGHYPQEEREKMAKAFALAADCAEVWLKEGIEKAMMAAAKQNTD